MKRNYLSYNWKSVRNTQKQYKNNFNKHTKLSKNRSRHNWGIPNIGPTDMKFYTKENPYIPFYWKIYPWKDGRRKIVITSLPLARHCAFLTMQGNLFVHAIGRLHPLCLSIYLDVATFIDDINFKVISEFFYTFRNWIHSRL